MINHILEIVAGWIITTEQTTGLIGIAILMAIESACIPLPSEVIMPFAGYLVYKGAFSLWGAGLAGALGCVVGSWVAYFAGMYGGRPLAEKYGKYILLNMRDLELADRLFFKHGEMITFFSRLLPVIRTFIAFPAGVSKMNLTRFSVYTFLGSLPWCLALAWIGQKLGENWNTLHDKFHQADLVIAVLLAVGAGFWFRHHISFLKTTKASQKLN